MTTTVLVNNKPMVLEIGMEATYSVGSDSYPAKLIAFKETPKYLEIKVQTYNFKWDKKNPNAGMGHQDWGIQWDSPLGTEVHRYRKDNGKRINRDGCGHITLGAAHVYRDWSF